MLPDAERAGPRHDPLRHARSDRRQAPDPRGLLRGPAPGDRRSHGYRRAVAMVTAVLSPWLPPVCPWLQPFCCHGCRTFCRYDYSRSVAMVTAAVFPWLPPCCIHGHSRSGAVVATALLSLAWGPLVERGFQVLDARCIAFGAVVLVMGLSRWSLRGKDTLAAAHRTTLVPSFVLFYLHACSAHVDCTSSNRRCSCSKFHDCAPHSALWNPVVIFPCSLTSLL